MKGDKLMSYSKSYCRIRIPIGIFFTVFLGVLMLIISYKANAIFDENKLVSTDGKITSSRIVNYRMMYFPELSVKYTVANKEYTHTAVFYQHAFGSKKSAQEFLENTLLQKEIPVYYYPESPEVVVFFVNEIRFMSSFLRYFAIILFFFAGVMFLLKDNPIFCGFTIFSDLLSIFRLV